MAILLLMNKYFSVLPNPEKMFTAPHRAVWSGYGSKNKAFSAPKMPKNDGYAQKVSVSEHSIITVYIYFVIFEAIRRLSERCKAQTFTK